MVIAVVVVGDGAGLRGLICGASCVFGDRADDEADGKSVLLLPPPKTSP